MKKRLLNYGFIVLLATLFDRITKSLAIWYLSSGEYKVFPGLNFTLSLNRGISFGLFHSESPPYFMAVTAVVLSVLVVFGFYTFNEYKMGSNIMPELLVIVGGISNLIDRAIFYETTLNSSFTYIKL